MKTADTRNQIKDEPSMDGEHTDAQVAESNGQMDCKVESSDSARNVRATSLPTAEASPYHQNRLLTRGTKHDNAYYARSD